MCETPREDLLNYFVIFISKNNLLAMTRHSANLDAILIFRSTFFTSTNALFTTLCTFLYKINTFNHICLHKHNTGKNLRATLDFVKKN